MRSRLVLGGPIVIAATVIGLTFAPSAMALTNYTWTGGDMTGNTSGANPAPSGNWSLSDNWDVAGVPSGTVDQLTFNDLAACDAAPTSAACYTSVDNAGPLTVGEITIDDGAGYNIYPDSQGDSPLTLVGNGGSPNNIGLSATQAGSVYAFPEINIPITLGAGQE